MKNMKCSKQLLTIVVLSAIMGSTTFAATTKPVAITAKPVEITTLTTPQGINVGTVSNVPVPTNVTDTTATADAGSNAAPIAVVATPTTAAELPYANAISDAALAPYSGKTVTSIAISPVPSPDVEAQLLPKLAMRVGDAVNADYIRHDVNAIGGSGLFSEVTPSFVAVPEGVKLTYATQINPIIKKVVIEGNTIYTTKQLQDYLGVQPNSILNTTVVSEKVAGITELYNKDGYMLAKVSDVKVTPEGLLYIKINEGVIEDIKVNGNKKTKTYVILRELKLKKGGVFNKNLARRSIERIYNTGYFEDANMRLLPGSDPNTVIIEVDVLEQKTGTVTVGAGYSQSDGLVGILGLGETNFRGVGDKVNLNWEFGGNTDSNKNYIFSYTRPWINDKGDSLGFSIFDRDNEYDDYNSNGDTVATYDKKIKGYNISLGRTRSEYTTDYFTFESKKSTYSKYVSGYNYGEGDSYATNGGIDFSGMDYLGKNFGTTNSVTWSHVNDNRDNVYDPTRGRRLSFTTQMAGHGLGGDFDYLKYTLELRTYKKVGHAQVLAFRAMGGYASGSMPYNDLFTLGGADTLRGYEDDQFRGNKMYAATLEYRYPIMKKVQGVVFTDMGNAWGGTGDIPWYNQENTFHVSAGVGVRITTPIGPIRLDYGQGTDGGKFHFSFGGKF